MKRVQELSWQLEQRIVIHFCVKIGWTFDEILHGLQTCFANQRILSTRSIHRWISQFRTGRTVLVDRPRAPRGKSGRNQRNVHRVENIVASDRGVTIKDISQRTGISITSVQRILKKDLKLKKKCASFVPAVLTDAHKTRRRDVCNFFTRLKGQCPRVFTSLVTMDESWIYTWDPRMRIHNKEWLHQGEDKPLVPRKTLATAKVMIVSFFDAKGMVYYEFVQRPQTVNQQVFRGIFRRFDAGGGHIQLFMGGVSYTWIMLLPTMPP